MTLMPNGQGHGYFHDQVSSIMTKVGMNIDLNIVNKIDKARVEDFFYFLVQNMWFFRYHK